jgi:EmrB/QacA subfamily drug resistance transporter
VTRYNSFIKNISRDFNSMDTTLPKQNKWLVLLCVGIGAFLSSLNSSLTSTILPTIEHSLKTTLSQSEWVVLIYLLIMTVTLIPIGRLSDLSGHRKIFLSGFALFICSAILCGCSSNFFTLILGRALLAFGGSILLSVGPAIITTTFSAKERGKALGIQALMTYIGLSLGPLLGGSITQLLGWHFAFFLSVPFGLAGFVLALLYVKDVEAASVKSIDVRGMVFFAIAMTAATILMNGASITSSYFILLLIFILMILSFLLFFHSERKTPSPMMPLSLFRIQNFGFGAIGAAFNYLCFYLMLFIIPFYFDRVLHSSAMQTGIIFTITPIIMTVCSPIVGALSDRLGSRVFTMTGMGFSILSLLLFGIMAKTTPATAFLLLILGLICAGFGTGVFAAPNNSAIMGAAPKDYQGVASGVVATFRNIGMIAGTTIGGSLFSFMLLNLSKKDIPAQQAFLSTFSIIMWIGAIFGIMGFACSFSMDKSRSE